MPTELESKIRVDSHEPAREKLRLGSAAYIGRVIETNRILDRDDGSLFKDGVGLRIRTVKVLDGKAGRPTITYKGPRLPGPLKKREELETTIDDPDALAAIFSSLGYRSRIIFEKRRETWLLGPCNVELDEIPGLGRFIEVEGPTADAIQGVLSFLDLSEQPSISESYVGLLTAGKQPMPGQTLEFRF